MKLQSILAVTVALLALAGGAQADLKITEVMSDSNGVSDDWWELTNTGSAAIELAGYVWNDDDASATDDEAIFPAFTLQPGSSVVILEVDDDNLASFQDAWGSGFDVLTSDLFGGGDNFSGLSKGGDELWLFDPSYNVVDSVSFGGATEGYSFEWSTSGADLGLSVVGEHGAYASSPDGDDVASPGVVPEPASLTVLALGAVAVIRRRR